MRTLSLLLLMFPLVGCGGGELDAKNDTPNDKDKTKDPDPEVDCFAEVVDVTPAQDDLGIALDTEIVVTLSDPAVDGQITVDLIPNTPGTLSLAANGLTATFTPDDDLSTGTLYTVDVTDCVTTVSVDFETQSGPVDPNQLVDNTYGVLEAEVNWIAPAAGAALDQFVDLEYFLLEITGAQTTAQTLDTMFSTGSTSGSTVAANCLTATDGGIVDFSDNPLFHAGPTDLPIPIDATTSVTIEDFEMDGTFNAPMDELQNVVMTGSIDTRNIDAYVPAFLGGDLCALASTLSGGADSCVACRDSAIECLTMYATVHRALLIDNLSIAASCPP